MVMTPHPDRENYRAILFAQEGRKLLVVPSPGGLLLPAVQVPQRERLADNIAAAVRSDWGQEAICLFDPQVNSPICVAEDHNYQVMECHGAERSHPGGVWVEVPSLLEPAFADPADHAALRQSVAACGGCLSRRSAEPFARLGWFHDVEAWAEEVVGRRGFHLTGSFSQLNASPAFSLVRFRTTGPAVWFKAVGKPNLREFPVTLSLARLFPQYVPTVLAMQPAWNGWLALEAEGASLSATEDPHAWKLAASALAKLQIESLSRAEVLIESGARDLRTSALLKRVRPFMDAMGQLMARQLRVPPAVLSGNQLDRLTGQIEEVLSLCIDSEIPDGLGHLDLNPGNMMVTKGQCVFLDWAEAYVGNPFFSLQYLVEHFRRSTSMGATAESVLTNAYAEEWEPVVSAEKLAKALALAPMLAVFACAAGSETWSDDARLSDPRAAGYLRSLTRRLQCEAGRRRDRSLKCPS